MNIDHLLLPWKNQLLEDYYDSSHSSSISLFFSYNPWKEINFQRRYQYLQDRKVSVPRELLVQALRSYYGSQTLHPKVETNLNRLLDPKSCVVIGGHQACLMTGPLFTLYKAVTIIQLATREEERLGVPVIPVFWIAGEDHDYEEVNHIWICDLDQQLVKESLTHSSSSINRRPISSIPIESEMMIQWLRKISQKLPDTVYKKEWLSACKQVIQSSQTWSQLFGQLMNLLFQHWGLLLMDAADVHIRRLETPFFIDLVHNNEQIGRQIQESAKLLKTHQYESSIHIEPDHSHLFIHLNEERFPLFRQGEVWMTRDGSQRFTTKELIQMAKTTPEKLSNNVLTRPLMQEFLFPTLAYVGGPGEISYWALLKDTFTLMGLQMPIVYPRSHITLVDQTAWKRMQQFQLEWSDLFYRFEQKRDEWLQKESTIDMNQVFEFADREIDKIYQKLIKTLKQNVGVHMEDIGLRNQKYVKKQLQYLRSYSERMIEEQYQHQLRRFDEIAIRLLPLNQLQERVYNLIQVWNQHGIQWLDDIIQQPLLTGEHHLVRL